jgi:hypothetical protein
LKVLGLGHRKLSCVWRGTEVLVIQAFDGKLFVTIEDQIFAVRKLLDHEVHSKEFDRPKKEERKRKIYVPPMSHPWKAASFKRYLRKIGKTMEEYECEKASAS